MIDDPVMWLAAGGLLVLVFGIWIKRLQTRFVAGLRADGDPLADHPGTKTFRQRFQAWLFGMGEADDGPAPLRVLVTVAMVLLLGAIAADALLPELLR